MRNQEIAVHTWKFTVESDTADVFGRNMCVVSASNDGNASLVRRHTAKSMLYAKMGLGKKQQTFGFEKI